MMLRFAVAALFACSAAYAEHLTIQNARSQEIVSAARQLEKSRTSYTPAQLDELTASDGMAVALETCRSDILRPALSVQLVSAAVRDPGADFDGWSKAMDGAQKFASHMARCMPSEGNAWVREALLSRVIAEAPGELSEKIAVAAALSPYEYTQLQARLVFWSKASPATLKASQDTLTADLGTILTYGDDRLLKPLLVNTPETLNKVLDQEVARLPDDHRNFIEEFRGKLHKSSRAH